MKKKPCNKIFSVIIFFSILASLLNYGDVFSVNVEAAGTVYYVATTGNDNTGDGSLNNPWKTVQKAASIMTAGDTCEIRGGTYRETVIPANSGTSGAPIKFRAYNGEDVTISGADAVTGWTQHSGNIYKAPLAQDTHAVFVDKTDMIEARWPNKTNLDKLNRHDLGVADGGSVTTLVDAALHGGDDYWNGAFVWFTGGGSHINWSAQTSYVTDYDSSSKKLTIQKPQNEYWHRVPAKGSLFYLTGKLSELDMENEWHYENGYLYLWAPGGVDPSTKTVEVKRRKWAFNLENKNYIEISDIKVFAGSANLENSTYCVIDNCEFKYVASDPWINYTYSRGGYGDHVNIAPWWDSTWNDVGVYIGGSNNVLKNSKVEYSYGDCVTVVGDNNTVKNNILHDANISATECGVVTVKGLDHEILCNTMYNAGRSILQFNYVERSRFLYNNMYEPGKLTKDLGVAYCYISDGKGTEIAYNWVHDNHAGGAGSGIYLDNGSSNFILHHNVIWNCPTMEGIVYNVPSDNMQTYNNTIYDTGGSKAIRMGDHHTRATTYNNLSHKNLEGDDMQNNLTISDPKFVNTGDGGLKYRLSSSSPAIDGGRVIQGITNSYVGSAPDIGAYEYGGTDWIAGHTAIAPQKPVKEPLAPSEMKNDAEEGINFSAGWNYYPAYYDYPHLKNCYKADVHASYNPGEYVEYTFTGNKITWIGGKNVDHGKVDVYIDGQLDAVVDTYGPSFVLQQELYTKSGLSDGEHTIKIVLRDDKNPASTGYCTDVDAFKLYPKTTVVNVKDDNNNIAETGSGRTLICKADHFNNALTVMTDGILDNSADSWNNQLKTEDYWGISFDKLYGFNKVVFTSGVIAVDGGWFGSGLKVQVRQSGKWVDVTGLNISPAYPYNNSAVPNKSYTMTFDDTWGDAIRVHGVPATVSGYNFSFTTIGEFEAYYMKSAPAPSIVNQKDDNNNIARTGSGRTLICKADQFNNALTVMTDGILDNSADSWNNKLKTEDYWGISFDKLYGFNKVVFTSGVMAVDGGWFGSGLKVQVRQSDQWVDVAGLNISPAYPYNNTSVPNKSYTMTFDDTWGDAIRVYGVPAQVSGYNFSFTTIGEFEAYYTN